MSQYTTGEMAKACGVTVRTVQFYDQRGILLPSALSEGGRRLYSDDDLKRLKIICFLRDTGLSLDTIGQLLKEEDPGSVISIMLEQQEQVLEEEIAERQRKLDRLEGLQKELKAVSSFSIETIGDIAAIMENKKKLEAMRRNMLLTGIPLAILQGVSILLWILRGVWQPFVLWLALAIPFGILWSRYYYRHTAYICPQCHEVFRPGFREAFWTAHTRKARRLSCVKCGHHGFCVEAWGGDEK
ncbi:MAG: MerR family transcriptional regulator [Clostridia bacterium]|nr:MerR family transcriptional regulator [Clostridia bacterium]